MPEDVELPLYLLLTGILWLLFISKSGIIQPMGLFKRSDPTSKITIHEGPEGPAQGIAPSPEVVREEFVQAVNVIHGPDGQPTHFIRGRTLRPDNLGRIRLIEDMGSPATVHWAYRTTDGVYHLDSQQHIPDKKGRRGMGSWVLRQRAYVPDDVTGSYKLYTMDTPRQRALGQSIDAAEVLHREVRELPLNAEPTTLLVSGHAQPWNVEDSGLWDGLSHEDQARMSVVDDTLSVVRETHRRSVGAFAAVGTTY